MPEPVQTAWDEMLDGYTIAVTDAGLRESTIRVHVEHCRDLMRFTQRAPNALDEATLRDWLSRPSWAYRTRQGHRASIHAVLSWALDAGHINANPLEGVYASGDRTLDASTDDQLRHALELSSSTEHPARSWARRTRYPHAPTGRLSEELLAAWQAAGCPSTPVRGASVIAQWQELLDDFAGADRAAGNRPATTRLRRRHLEQFAGVVGLAPGEVDRECLVDWLATEQWSPSYRRGHRASLSRVFTWAYESGRLSSNPASNLPRVRVPSSVPRPAPETVIRDAVLGASPAVRLMVLLGSLQGLRRAEIAGLRIGDFTESDVHVSGKGGRERLVPIHPALRPELAAYLELTRIESGWLFPNRRGTDHLSIEWVGVAVSRRLPAGFSAHQLRHRFASRAYAGAFDIRSVQELLGHSSPAVTARYVAVPSTQLVNAVLAVPPIPGIGPPPASAGLREQTW
jgi:integrase